MKRKMVAAAVFSLVLTVCLVYLFHGVAEAARMGGGRSFGSKPSYQRSAPAPSPSPTQPGVAQQPRQNPAAAPGAMGGRWGGMLGGLLMGGLLGSMLFGGEGMGGPGLLDILVIGGGLFLLMRFLRARRMATQSASASGLADPFHARSTQQSWGASGQLAGDEPAAAEPQAPVLPPGFDADEFLQGAKAIYARLQAAWDKRDLEDIRSFTSPEVFAEIKQQAEEDMRVCSRLSRPRAVRSPPSSTTSCCARNRRIVRRSRCARSGTSAARRPPVPTGCSKVSSRWRAER